jgi:cellulase/cellobiase CelA1
VTYVNRNDWGNGATIDVTIRNTSAAAVNGWTLTWTFPGNQRINNLWNGAYTQSNALVSVSNATWNRTISANGGTANFGFNIVYSGANTAPASFSLNGTPCQ